MRKIQSRSAAAALKAMRTQGGFSQKELGQLLSVDESIVSKRESATTKIPTLTLLVTADACGFELRLLSTKHKDIRVWQVAERGRVNVGEALRLMREANGLRQTDLAKRLVINQSQIAVMEKERRKAPLDLVLAVARICGFTPTLVHGGKRRIEIAMPARYQAVGRRQRRLTPKEVRHARAA